MRVLVACKRGGLGPRDQWGHCLCDYCKQFTAARRKRASKQKAAYNKAWREANPEKCAMYQKKWLSANKEKRRQIEMAWRARNPEKVKEMNRKAGAKWSKENAAARNAITQARRTAKLQRNVAWANKELIRSFYEEAIRLSRETGVPHEVDHIYPLQGETVSGLHVETNLQVIPKSANRSKGARLCAA